MRTQYIIWWAILVHLVWGFTIAIDPTINPIIILVGLHWIVALGLNGPPLGILLMVAAIIAAVGLVLDHKLSQRASLLMLMPQYTILIASFISDIQSVIIGEVNHTSIDRLLLFTALWPVILAAALHTMAIIERYMIWTHRR